MIKLIAATIIFSISTPIMASSCFPLYEAEASKIREDKAYTENVGMSLYLHQGQLAVWPGVEVPGKVDNWAEDLLDSIKWGQIPIHDTSFDKRGAWLKAFNRSIKKDCKLPEDNFVTLRKMLTELMEDGTFCPNSQIIKPKFLKGKSEFKELLKKAVSDQRLVEYCQGKSVADDSFRSVKDVDSKSAPDTNRKGSQKQ